MEEKRGGEQLGGKVIDPSRRTKLRTALPLAPLLASHGPGKISQTAITAACNHLHCPPPAALAVGRHLLRQSGRKTRLVQPL